MTKRLSAVMALIVFAFCLVVGMRAGNPFSSTVGRAMVALFATLLLGMVIGTMAEKMLEENLKAQEEKLKNSSTNSEASDR
jgi:NhaP-type Na+/H+ or K+/H+ antiporter